LVSQKQSSLKNPGNDPISFISLSFDYYILAKPGSLLPTIKDIYIETNMINKQDSTINNKSLPLIVGSKLPMEQAQKITKNPPAYRYRFPAYSEKLVS
jgi:hypothetical protein